MMKQKAFRLTALLLCLILIFTLGACKGETEEVSTDPDAGNAAAGLENTSPSGESLPPASDMESQDAESTGAQETGGQTPDTPDDSKETNSSEKATEPVTRAQQDSQPKSTAEIVAYYNKAANKIKTDKPGYQKVNVKNKFPGSSASLGVIPIGSLLSLILGEETTNVKKGQSSNNTFPAAGFSWASKLTKDYVKNATCTKSGSNYNIKITLKDETNPQIGKGGYGSCMSVIDKAGAQEMMGKALTIQSITMQYHDGYISATIDIATGRIIYAELYAASKMENVKTNLGTANLDIDSKETFTNFQW